MKSVWPGQAREQLSTPPALPQDSWAGGEALARERHLPVSGEKEDTREGLRDRGRPLGAGRPLSVNQEELPPPVGALARPSWWEGAAERQSPHPFGCRRTLGPGRGALPRPRSTLSARRVTLRPDLSAGLDPLQQRSLPTRGNEWLEMDMGFLVVTDLETREGHWEPSLGQTPDTSTRCLKMS